MKNRLILILVLAIFVIVLVLALHYPGEVIVKLAGYPKFIINFYFLVTILIVLILVSSSIVKLLATLLKLPTYLSHTHHRRQQAKDEQIFRDGLHLYLQGNYTQASRLFMKATQSKSLTLIAGLFAADAALLNNDIKTARKAIILTGVSPDEDDAADMIVADIAINDEAPESVAFRINNIIDKQSNNLRAIRMLIKLCEKSGTWHLAEQALHLIDKALYDAPRRQQYIRKQITVALLKQATKQKDKQLFHRIWQQANEQIKGELLESYIFLSLQLGNIKETERYLEKMIEQNHNERAIEQYGLLSDSGVKHRIKRSEHWLAQYPDNPALLLCLARLYKTNAQPDKAKEYLQKSLAVEPSYQAWFELNEFP